MRLILDLCFGSVSRKRRSVALLVASISIAISDQALFAMDCSVASSEWGLSPGSFFELSFAGFTRAEVDTAIGYWSGCAGYGSEIPDFTIGYSGGVPVSVIKKVGRSDSPLAEGSGCGLFDPEIVNRRLESAELTIWTLDRNGNPCPTPSDVLAHEFGHVLGLADVADFSCAGRIMGMPIAGTTRIREADDCAVADDRWETPQESQPIDDPWCDAYCWTSCVNNVCPIGHPGCPILFDIENDGFHMTGLEDPVLFDIDADGNSELMSWTDRGEGLLALDRNGNGSIDDGQEIFGNYTRLSDGTRALNGYLALAELDTASFGGNGDDQIDATDMAFSALRVWIDRNHDGRSQPDELQPLAAARIVSIGLDYRRSNRTDQYGNEFRFLGRAWKIDAKGVKQPILTWDVFFQVAVP